VRAAAVPTAAAAAPTADTSATVEQGRLGGQLGNPSVVNGDAKVRMAIRDKEGAVEIREKKRRKKIKEKN
jgi:hypothetical protein